MGIAPPSLDSGWSSIKTGTVTIQDLTYTLLGRLFVLWPHRSQIVELQLFYVNSVEHTIPKTQNHISNLHKYTFLYKVGTNMCFLQKNCSTRPSHGTNHKIHLHIISITLLTWWCGEAWVTWSPSYKLFYVGIVFSPLQTVDYKTIFSLRKWIYTLCSCLRVIVKSITSVEKCITR